MPGVVDSISLASAHGGGTVSFAVGSNKAAALKVQTFNAVPRFEGAAAPKLQTQGKWPGFLDPRELIIDIEGQCVGATPSAYWTARAALLAAAVPPYDYSRSIRHHSTMTVTFPGQSPVYALVNLLEYDFPVTAAGGRHSEYRFSWVAYFGYWRLVSNDAAVIL